MEMRISNKMKQSTACLLKGHLYMQLEKTRQLQPLLKLCCCPGGCCFRGQWEGDSLWSQECLCLHKAKGRSWQDSHGPGSRAARPGSQHPLCWLWFSCFFANCLAWMTLSIRQSCVLYRCWTGLPVPSESSSCWCWRLEEDEDVLAYCGNLFCGHYNSGSMEIRSKQLPFPIVIALFKYSFSLLKLSIGVCMYVPVHVCMYECVHEYVYLCVYMYACEYVYV